MSRPRPLFIMGNKRSGSTIMVNLLNTHPQVFLSHEADTIWILYQSRNGKPDSYNSHPLDSTMEMNSTLKNCGRILNSTLSRTPSHDEIVEAFHRVQEKLMKSYLKPSLREKAWRIFQDVGKRPKPQKLWRALRKKTDTPRKESLAWIGDKKHVQHIDPDIRPFLQTHFPDARYIHIVRHPKGVVASMMDAATHWLVMPEYFKGTAEQILEQWAIHEEWAIQAKERENSQILTVRLEDLCADPQATMAPIFKFLDLEMTEEVISRIPLLVHYKDPNKKYTSFSLPDLPRAKRIMEIYGYK